MQKAREWRFPPGHCCLCEISIVVRTPRPHERDHSMTYLC